jgi:hypothetical protein
MLDHSLTRAERSGDARRTALCNGEEHIYYPLAGKQWHIRAHLCQIRPGLSYRPSLDHGHLPVAVLAFDDCYGIRDLEFAFLN